MKQAYPIILTPAERGYVVSVPDLDINTEGETIADAISMAEDAIGLWGITMQDMGKSIPDASGVVPPCAPAKFPPLLWWILTHTVKQTICVPFGKMSPFRATLTTWPK